MRKIVLIFGVGMTAISIIIVMFAYLFLNGPNMPFEDTPGDKLNKSIDIELLNDSKINDTEAKPLPPLKEITNPTISAIKEDNIAYCDHFETDEEISGCKQVVFDMRLNKQAIETFNSKFCEEIVNENTRNSCLELTKSGEEHLKENKPEHIASFYLSNKDYDKAIYAYEELLVENESVVNLLALAIIYAEKGLSEQEKGNSQVEYVNKSLELIKKAKVIEPTNSDAYRIEGYAYEILPDYFKSIEAYDKSIELNSNNIEAYSGRGHTYRLMGILDKALTDFEKASSLDIKKTDTYTYINLCSLESSRGRYDKAVEYCTIVTRIEDHVNYLYKSQAHLVLGNIYLNQRNYTEAENHFLMAKSISPKDNNVKLALVKLHNTKRELKEAELIVKEVIEDVPTRSYAYQLYSYNLYLQEKFDSSIKTAEKGLDVLEDDVSMLGTFKDATREQLYYIIANCYDQKGDVANKDIYVRKAEEVYN